MYDTGRGVMQDFKQAVQWYAKSAKQGYARAQTALGYMYSNGKGVAQDFKSAAHWYTKAAEQGSSSAQLFLAWLYYEGKGVSQDFIQAHAWANISAAKGSKSGLEIRDIIAKEMTMDQVYKAQQIAKNWIQSD